MEKKQETKQKKEAKPLKKTEKTSKTKKENFFEGVGRRKTAVARVRLFPQKEKTFFINDKKLEDYFPTKEFQQTVLDPLVLMSVFGEFKVLAKVNGGGTIAQVEAVRHGIARALVLFNPSFRKKLKKAGYLKRDPRMRERKKFGLKRARRAPQWSKR